MTNRSRTVRSDVAARWREFWFTAEEAYPLGLVRIAFGALMIGWSVSLLPNLQPFFGVNGVMPVQPQISYHWGFLTGFSDTSILVSWCILVCAAAALTVGWHSRLAALVVFVLVLSFQHRNVWVFNSGDGLIRTLALFLAVSPCGAALSLDRRRSVGRFWSSEVRARWPVRLLQVQLSLIYLASVQVKLDGDTWPDGTAVSYALRLEDMIIIPVPQWVSTSPLLTNVATWGTLAVELAIGVLVWNRLLRRYVLAAGIAMHISIMLSVSVGFFTPAMFVLYLAFIPSEAIKRLPKRIRRSAEPPERVHAASP